MRSVTNWRGKALIAIISVVLLLAVLFATDTLELRLSSTPSEADASTASDMTSRVAKAADVPAANPAGLADPVIASSMPVAEQTPLPASGAGDTGVMATPEWIATPAADSLEEKKPEARPGTVAAECWGLRGSARTDFVVTLDREMRTSGEASALISAQRESAGYVTMFQTSAAGSMRGRRVEFSADVRTRGATRGANLLLRAEDAYGRTVAFDNMQTYGADGRPDQRINRGVKGDAEWSTQHVVVDIPDSAQVITYGVSVFGGGKAWIDNARVEIVTNDMPTTAIDVLPSPTLNGIPVNPASLTRSPRNLEFDLEARAGAAPCN